MIGRFTGAVPEEFKGSPIVISGEESPIIYDWVDYVVFEDEDKEVIMTFEIRNEDGSCPFKHAEIWNNLLLVGLGEHFYMYDLQRNKNILSLKMEWYFGYLYIHNDLFYIADSSKLYCINSIGHIDWESDLLGVDGVIVNDFFEDKIYGQGEWDLLLADGEILCWNSIQGK